MTPALTISAAWLTAAGTQRVLRLLEDAGHQAFVVGGALRNHLMGYAVEDIDIATDATPDAVMALASGANVKCVDTGAAHGTVSLIVEGQSFEVTSFRRDVETFGRHATVAFGTDLTADAARRDFTINALYAEATGAVFDPTGQGLDDLRARRLRFIGAADARIREDYLRILRYFRFHAFYAAHEAGFDPDILAACADNAEGIALLSRERIGGELCKLLAAPNPAPAMAAMSNVGVLRHCITGIDLRALPPLIHLEGLQKISPSPARRLAALGGEEVQTALRLSKSLARKVALLRDLASGGMAAAEMGYRHGMEMARDALLLRHAFFETPLDLAEVDAAQRGACAKFPVTAADLMPQLQGPELGQKLAELEADWIASDFSLSRADLLRV